MPCNSDYMEPTTNERKNKKSAQNLLYVLTSLDKTIPNKLKHDADHYYGGDDYTVQLCAELKQLTKEQQDSIIYDGRNKEARRLADWWEVHQKIDQANEDLEKRRLLKEKALKTAQTYLTKEELKALGLPED